MQPIETARIAEADRLKKNFEELLEESVDYAQRINLSEEAIHSNEFVTPYTLKAEKKLPVNRGQHKYRYNKGSLLFFGTQEYYTERLDLEHQGSQCRIIKPASKVINYQRNILALSLRCEIFITLYADLLSCHPGSRILPGKINSPAKQEIARRTLCEELNFWNHVMGGSCPLYRLYVGSN